MSIIDSMTLFGIMVVLAAIPGASVALVVVRSATSGIGHGVAVAAGIVLGDLFFIMLAILGLSVVAEIMGSLFIVIRYLGAAYLIWLGLSLLRRNNATIMSMHADSEKSGLLASLLAGLVLTLGDIKAVFFYVSLFPVFVDLAELRLADILIVVLVTTAGVGGIKMAYALAATRMASLAGGLGFENVARKTAGGMMVGAGSYIIAKA